jgi:hypothetical protein
MPQTLARYLLDGIDAYPAEVVVHGEYARVSDR